MILSENRYPLFRIMLSGNKKSPGPFQAGLRVKSMRLV
jgi:hypothetical protein